MQVEAFLQSRDPSEVEALKVLNELGFFRDYQATQREEMIDRLANLNDDSAGMKELSQYRARRDAWNEIIGVAKTAAEGINRA